MSSRSFNSSRTSNQRCNSSRNQKSMNPVRVLDLSARQVNGPNDPPSLITSVITTIRVGMPVAASDVSGTITPATLIAAVPGTTGYWKYVRLHKVSVYGLGGLAVNLNIFENNRKFADIGVPGAKASALHVSLPLIERANWYPVASTTSLVSWGSSAANTPQVHCTVELMS